MRRTLFTAGLFGLVGIPVFAQNPITPQPGPSTLGPQFIPASAGFVNQTPIGPNSLRPTAPQNLPPLKASPYEPALLPPGVGNTTEPTDGQPRPDPNVRLPQKENLSRIDVNSLLTRRGSSVDRWQVVNGFQVLREFTSSQTDADEFVRLMRDLRPTEWAAIGTSHTVVEYGLNDGKAMVPSFTPKTAVSIDVPHVRVELVRGVWVLRDDENILLNFGKNKGDAEQAFAVIRKYGFNRLAQVGPASGGATVLFSQSNPISKPKVVNQYAELSRHLQEQQLTRTGLDVPAAGQTGEKITIDPKSCEIRRDKGHWVLAHGGEVLADFGMSEWSARDALKLVQEQRFTEFCRFNADVTFFLTNGQPPSRVPFAVQAVRFDKETLQVKGASGGKFGVYEGMGRQLFVCDTEKEAKQLIGVLKHYGFDTSCQMGLSGKSSLKFLAKTGR